MCVPPVMLVDRPLEIELKSTDLHQEIHPLASSLIATHCRLSVAVENGKQPPIAISSSVSVRMSGGRLFARALIHPARWIDATHVTVISLALAEKPVACDCFPFTMRVGYNHAPAPAGALLAAADAGDLAALQAALDAGGSTEEADQVRALEDSG